MGFFTENQGKNKGFIYFLYSLCMMYPMYLTFYDEVFTEGVFFIPFYRKEKNCLEAFCNGAIDGTKICACIIGNLIAIVSLLEFVNMTLLWLGNMADIENLSFSVSSVFSTFCFRSPATFYYLS